jgi:hypothetical protein
MTILNLFTAIWYNLWAFDKFVVIWYIFHDLVFLEQEKSGNHGVFLSKQSPVGTKS